MQRVKTSTAVANKAAYSETGTPGHFTNGDAVAGIPATVPGQDWFNMVQEELLNVIKAAEIDPNSTDDTQLAQAIAKLLAAHDVDGDAHEDLRALIAALGGSRVESLWLGAGAMIPNTTNGATAGTGQSTSYLLMSDYLDFGAAADQSAQAIFALPANWDMDAVKIKLHWRPAAAGSTAGQYVGWAVSGGAVGDGDTADRALGAAVTVADQALAGLEAAEHITPASAALTIGGDPQVGDRLHLKITRQAAYAGGGAAMPVAARLLGLELQYTTTGNAVAWG